MQTGWIKLHRRILDWEWYSNANCFRIFLHLLLKANISDRKFEGRDIKRGQLVTSTKKLSTETGLSEQSVKTAIKHLKSTNDITTLATSKYTVITVVNYEVYQCYDEVANQEDNQQSNQLLTSEQPTANQQLTTKEEYKNIRNKENKNIDHDPFIDDDDDFPPPRRIMRR